MTEEKIIFIPKVRCPDCEAVLEMVFKEDGEGECTVVEHGQINSLS